MTQKKRASASTKSRRRPTEDKARRPNEDKLAREQATLERDATFDGHQDDRQYRIRKCFNRNCPDYGVERRGGEPCECRSPGGANYR